MTSHHSLCMINLSSEIIYWLCFLVGTLVSVAAQTRQYFFVSTELIWSEAQRLCRNNFTDLATIENTADVGAVLNTTAHNGEFLNSFINICPAYIKWLPHSHLQSSLKMCFSFDESTVTNPLWTGKAWIGLHDELVNSWSWSLKNSSFYGAGEADFRNWNISEPDNFNGQQYCVVLFTGSPYFGTWGDVNCTVRHPFICYSGEFCYSLKMDR